MITKHKNLVRSLIWSFLLSAFTLSLHAADTIRITAHPDNIGLEQFIREMESEYPVTFYYEEDWVAGVRVTGAFENEPLDSVLGELLRNTGISWYFPNSATVILYRSDAGHALSATHSGNQETIGSPSRSNGNNLAEVKGKVLDGNTGEPLIGATVYVKELNKGTITGKDGTYRLNVQPGNYHLEFSSIGYLKADRKVTVFSSGTLNVELYEKILEIEQVEVKASENKNDQRSVQMSANTLSERKIKEMPSFLGEADVVKSLLLLPGVSSSGESSAGINIRGGNADQNLFLLDDVPLFSYTHLFGFFSAINPDIVEDVTVYKGGIPAGYGGKLSSVVDVVLKDRIPDSASVEGSAGLIASRLSAATPLFKGRGSAMAAGRTSYTNWMLDMTGVSKLRNSSSGFYDANLKLTAPSGKNSTISLSTYNSRDRFNFAGEASQKYGTDYLRLHHNALWKSKFSSSLTGWYSRYRTQLDETGDTLIASRYKSGIDLSGLNYRISFFPSSLHKFSVGTDNLFYVFHEGHREALHRSSDIINSTLPDQQALETSFYLTHEYNQRNGFSVSYGLRLSGFLNLGESDVFLYQEGLPRSPSTITDTLHYDRMQVASSFGSIEPRISVKYQISPDNSVKFSYARTSQYIHLFSNTTGITPTDVWKPAGNIITPQKGDQVAAGVFSDMAGGKLHLSLESYYKWIDGIMDLKGGYELLMNPTLEAGLLPEKGRAYGVEFMMRKDGRLNGWISYTYARSERKVIGNQGISTINGGNYYPSDYDKPHDLKIVMNYRASARTSVSLNYIFTSGRPVTYPEGYYTISHLPVIQYSDKNKYRLPDYKRLDVSFNYKLYAKRKTRWRSEIIFSLYNVLGNDNTYSVFFRNEQNLDLGAYRVLLIDKPVPAISYSFKF